MEVHLTNPGLQTKLERWASETGRPANELVEDVMESYFAQLVETRETLDSRYDDIRSGKVKPIPGDEVIARLRERSAAFRLRNA